MQKVCGFIGDGYTLEKTIAEEPGVHPAMTVEFRPMTATERHAAGREISRVFPKDPAAEVTEEQFAESERIAAEQICRHVVSWNLQDHKNQPVELNPANAMRLERHLSGKLYKLVLGDRQEEDTAAKN